VNADGHHVGVINDSLYFEMMKSSRIVWADHVARSGNSEMSTIKIKMCTEDKFWETAIDGRKITISIIKKYRKIWTGLDWLIVGSGGGLL
jgi:hypothetical protein